MSEHEPQEPAPTDVDDTEGNAFKWEIVDDPKRGKSLRQGWDTNDPAPGKPQPRRSNAESDTKR